MPTDRQYDGYDLSSLLFEAPAQQQEQQEQQGQNNSLPLPPPFRSEGGPRDHFYYHTTKGAPQMRDNSTGGLMAVRLGQYKLHYFTQGSHCTSDYFDRFCYAPLQDWRSAPLLYNLDSDPGEVNLIGNTSQEYEHVVAVINQRAADYLSTFVPDVPPSEIAKGSDSKTRFPCCNPDCTPRPKCCSCAGLRPPPVPV